MTLRDGSRISLWQDTVSRYGPASVASAKKYDVAIVGGGMTGITLALLLQENGLNCMVLEAQTIGFGTTGGTTAHLNTLLDTPYPSMIRDFGIENAKRVAVAARSALQLAEHNVNYYGIDCGFEVTPAYLFSQTAEQERQLEKIHSACLEVGVDVNFTAEIPLPVSFNRAIYIDRQAKFHPLRYVFSLAKAFEEMGGVIMQDCRVYDSETDAKDPELININTSNGIFQSKSLVYATHIPTGVNILHLRCPAYRSYVMAVTLEDEHYFNGLAYDMVDPYHYYRTQEIDGKKYLIVGGEDHRTGDESNTNGCLLKLESHIRSHFNIRDVVHRWSSQFFEAVDGLPYIGHLPGNPKNVFVATGFGGNGMTYSHVAALVLKSIILREKNPLIEVFSPERIKPVAGFTEFVKHNADVVKQFVGKWFGKQELQEISQLAPGEAKVMKHKNHTIALYKDERGELHAVSPACTHMKCFVNWNAAERSWDCPCHGTRYSADGKVLNGPATHDLESVEIRSLVTNE